jgi:hypothetical protein
MSKPRVIKDFEKLDTSIQEQIKLKYPLGFSKHLITFKNAKGEFVSALLFETDEIYYLVRMTKQKAQQIIRDDDDYDDDGILKDEVRLDYSEKYDSDDMEDLKDEIGEDMDVDEDDSLDEDMDDEVMEDEDIEDLPDYGEDDED